MWNDEKYIPPAPQAAYQANGLTDGLILPVLKSIFLGFVSGVFCGLLTWAFKVNLSPWLVFALVWFGVMTIAFLRYSERGQWLIERICGADLNGDGFIGMPQKQPENKIRIELLQDEGRKGDFIDLPFSDRLPQLASGLIQGRQFAQTVWTGNNQLFSRGEFETLRGELLKRGLASWKNPDAPAQGIVLTGPGRAVMKRLAASPPPSGKDQAQA